ncbi:MAG: diguanylate cyclase [Flexilinea sp.]
MDIDRFDVINDCYGRDIGDDIIRHIASVLRRKRITVLYLSGLMPTILSA